MRGKCRGIETITLGIRSNRFPAKNQQSIVLLCLIFKYVEPTLQIDNPNAPMVAGNDYTCNILVGRNYLSYAVCGTTSSVICVLKHYYFKDKVIGKKDFQEILGDPFMNQIIQFKVAIDTPKSMLIPNELFIESEKEKYFKVLFDFGADETIYTQQLTGNKTAIFSLKRSTLSFLETLLPELQVYDANSCLLNAYPSLLFNDTMHTFFLNIKDDSASMSIYHKKELQFHQVYAESAPADLLYYVSSYAHQCALSNENMLILLLGEGPALQETQTLLSRYYSHLKFCGRIQQLQYPETLYAQPVHAFFNLFSLVTCA